MRSPAGLELLERAAIVGWPAAATSWNTVSTKPGLALVPNLALKIWLQCGPHCGIAAPAGNVLTVLRPMWSRRAGRSGSCPSRSFGAAIRASTAVVVVGLRQAQLGEDAAHVFLDGALGHPEAVGDARVGAALGRQAEDLALPGAEPIVRVVTPAGRHQLLH